MKLVPLFLTLSLFAIFLGCGASTSSQKSTLPAQTMASVVTIKVTSPQASASVSSTFSVTASATSSHPITSWQVDLDGSKVYTGPATSSINANINAPTGTHNVTVQAWDESGASGSQTVPISVTASAPAAAGPLPTPPSNAKTFSNIQQMNGWGSCRNRGCSGTSSAGSSWQALHQSSPSLSGSSMELFANGVWGGGLWWQSLGARDSITNMLWDFYIQVDKGSLANTQALEYDSYQFVGGYNYMVGSQCDYGYGVWDTYSASGHKWLHSKIPCKEFSPGSWHHIQWYVTTDHNKHTYTYVTLVVDGAVHSLNQTENAAHRQGWGDDLGVQWQLDVNGKGGGFHQWVDKAQLTVW